MQLDLLCFLVLVVVILSLILVIFLQNRVLKDLTNKLLARSYAEYANHEIAKENIKAKANRPEKDSFVRV